MPVIQSAIDPNGREFAANRALHLKLIDQLRELERKVDEASTRSEVKFSERGQLLPRQRIQRLLDRDMPFLELSTLAGLGMHEDDAITTVLGGGNIAGIGFVSGIRCALFVNDSGIKGGALSPMGISKALRIQAIAIENKLPFIQLVESAGANLLMQSEQFVPGGGLFANLARMSAAGQPVIAIVHGSSTAGGAYQIGLADYVILVRGRSKVFLAGPPLLRAATGEIADDESLGGTEMHATVSGLGEYVAENDVHALGIARELLSKLSWPGRGVRRPDQFEPPLYDSDELVGVVPADYRKPYDVREVIARVVDGSDFLEFKPLFDAYTICGHAAIEGRSVGILGNNGPITAAGARKATQFIQLCCQTGTPLLFLQNTTGFIVGVEAERAGIVKEGSKMIQAVTNANVPKVTIQIGAAFGAGYYAMCGRAFGPRFVFGWPNRRLAVMGGEQASRVLTLVAEDAAKRKDIEPAHDRLEQQGRKVREAFETESTAWFATARLWDDGLIDPRDTRRIVAFCLDTCDDGDRRVLRSTSFGVARM